MTAWTRAQFDVRQADSIDQLPVVEDDEVVPVADGIDIWDSWPIRNTDGSIADVCGQVVWVALAAPAVGDPGLRHDIAEHRAFLLARRRLVRRSRSAVSRRRAPRQPPVGRIDRARRRPPDRLLHADAAPGFRQRLAAATATVDCVGGLPRFVDWSEARRDPAARSRALRHRRPDSGEPGFIKAFRDPFPFVDPASGEQYLFFTGSLSPASSTPTSTARSGSPGAAATRSTTGNCSIRSSLPTASTTSWSARTWSCTTGCYYLFISTQSRTFHPDVRRRPGCTASSPTPCSVRTDRSTGTARVFVNPPSRPRQAYSWLVLNDLSVVGFVDAYGYDGDTDEMVLTERRDARRAEFGGTFSPTVHIGLDGDRARLASSWNPALSWAIFPVGRDNRTFQPGHRALQAVVAGEVLLAAGDRRRQRRWLMLSGLAAP